ncbi:fimbrial protein [Yersinia mollaretii]|uniref:fimbrial protein n=1 Tax=Yersinia mollaretii TaxID=33060 RepID=UPI0021BDDFCD|nr:fimbrial protein [Yersinia mollaretii]
MQQKYSRSGLHRPLTCRKTAFSRWKLMPFFLGSILWLTSTLALAQTTLTVKVTVLAAPSCVINGGDPIEVGFGDDVVTTRVDGHNYMQVIPANVRCSGLTNDSLRLRVQGNPAYFGTNVLATEQDDLGIALMSNGKPLRLNDNIQFTYPDVPVLSAVPVKYTETKLAAGQFSAGATLTVEYQ